MAIPRLASLNWDCHSIMWYLTQKAILPTQLKNDQAVAIVDENRIEQSFVAHIVHSCQQY